MVCESVGAHAAVLIGSGTPRRAVARHTPDPQAVDGWLEAALAATQNGEPSAAPKVIPIEESGGLYGQPARWHVLVLGLNHRTPTLAAVACLCDTRQGPAKQFGDRLVLASGWIVEFELRQLQDALRQRLEQFQGSAQLLDQIHASERFREAAMAFCNELASRFDLERVSMGVRRGPYMRLVAASSTEQLNRKMDYVQYIEAAMEESADQQEPVIHPPPEGIDTVSRAAGKLAHHVDAGAVCTLPLIREDRVEMALTLEASPERWPSVVALESIQSTLNLAGPVLLRRYESDRWVGAKALAGTRRLAAAAVGPRHTWVKLLALAVLAVALFLIVAKGTYRVEAPFVIEPASVQILDAPFDGTLESVRVEPGDDVAEGQELARLRTTELRMELLGLRADRERYAREADLAMREGEEADRHIALARRDQAEARIARLQADLDRAVVRSPIAGVVMEGDLRERVGGTTQRGEVLMKLMPEEALRGSVHVSESQINDVRIGAAGSLAPASDPSLRLPVTVQRIAPMARMEGASNVFPVRVQLESPPAWLAPGMEGVARIDVGERRYAWIWTREAVNWVRMQLWW
jgi:multidrug resistance efflux pump